MYRDAQIGENKMLYRCPRCNKTFTIPVGDYMIEKSFDCPCGKKSEDFQVYENTQLIKNPLQCDSYTV